MPDDHGITGITMSVNDGDTVTIDIDDLDAVVEALGRGDRPEHGLPVGQITVDGDKLCQALAAVVPHAGAMDSLEWLRIDIAGDTLTAYTTDRYTIGLARIDGEAIIDCDRDLWSIDILADDAKLIAAIFKPGKDQQASIRLHATTTDLTITDVSGLVTGRELTVGATTSVEHLASVPRLVAKAALDADQSVITSASAALWVTGPKQWAKFIKSATNYPRESIVVEAHEPNRPFLITIGEHFIGLLMPIRSDAATSEGRQHRDLIGDWIDTLPAPSQTHAA